MNRSEKDIPKKRFEAENVNSKIKQLMDSEIFPDLLYAMDNKDKDRFDVACKSAYIRDEMREYLWRIATKHSIYHDKYTQDQGFCWGPT